MPARKRHEVKTRMKQGHVSPKTVVAAVLPTLGGVIAVAIQWAVTGEFDRAELVTAATAFGGALISGLGAYVAEPGEVVTTR